MTDAHTEPLTLDVSGSGTVSALLTSPTDARAGLALAHGAGAGMHHAFMAAVAEGLGRRGIAVLRFQFPSMERASRRPDPPRVAHAAVRAAAAEARRRLGRVPLYAGGKSFGGRMTSQAHAEAPLAGVTGLVFLGFPLHPAGRPGDERGEHLARVACPMLFLQGTRDELADVALISALAARLGERATLAMFDDADHAFHVRARSGSNDAEVLEHLLDTIVAWMESVAAARPR
ncbi:MAG TPA: alpha/beta family hydrolase [Caldimonas sp.]|nr:alpha/beta family hydrolase [Caldimonas sp.]